MPHPQERRLVQYRKGLQLALRPTVDTEVKRTANEAELEATDGLIAMFEQQSDPKRQAVPQSDEPPTAVGPMNVEPPTQPIVPAAPMQPVLWETKFRTGSELFERLRALPPETQHNILTLLQTADLVNVGDGDDGPAKMVFAQFQGFNPDSNPITKQAGNTGKQPIWFELGFNPGGSLYPRNPAQGDALQVNDKNKTYFRVQVTGSRMQNDQVIVTLHVDDQFATQVTKTWAEAQVPAGARYKAAPGPFLNPAVKARQSKIDTSTLDELRFDLDINGYSVGPNGGIPELTIKHTDRGKGATPGVIYRKFFLKVTLASDPNVYQISPKFNIFGRVNDGGREATANLPLPLGYRVVQPWELDSSLGAGGYGSAAAVGPSSGAGSSTDPLVATVLPPPSAAPDPA